MSAPSKTVFRVQQVVAPDVAIIAEVKEGETHSGKVRETRDGKMILGGRDSFWLVGGERKESKFPLPRAEASSPLFASRISPIAARIRTGSVFELPEFGGGAVRHGKLEAVAFSTATRLSVGYTFPEFDADELLASLSQGTLQIPLAAPVSAIEVRRGQWLTSGFERLLSGRYRLTSQSLRGIAVSTLESQPETIKLAHGLVVFLTQPKWSPPRETDLRPEREILLSVEGWLSRSKIVLSEPIGSAPRTPSDLLRLLSQNAVSEDEVAELKAIAGFLSQRDELDVVLPKILAREPAFQERLTGFEEAEKARLRAEIEERVRRETEAQNDRLATLRSEIADAEAKLAAFSHREALLRSETEKHEETLRRRLQSAVESIRDDISRDGVFIRDEFARLREEMTSLDANKHGAKGAEPTQADEEKAEYPPLSSEEERRKTLQNLSITTGLTPSQVAAVVAMATEAVPVLIGAEASAAAINLATALTGDEAAVAFCDPTKVSLADILSDEYSGLAASIDLARRRPEAIVAVALCCITAGPCRYWLPHMVELRRIGRLPRNLALIASAEVDGVRVPVPDSVLTHFFPLAASNTPRPGPSAFGGPWPFALEAAPDQVQSAAETLLERGLEGPALRSAARTLARTPWWEELPDVIDLLLQQAAWLAAVAAGHDHDKRIFFRGTEG